MSQQTTNRPEFALCAVGGLSVAVWCRQETDSGGRTVSRFSMKLQKRFKDSQTGEWRTAEINLFPDEWPGLRMLGDKGYEHSMILDDSSGAAAA